MGVHLVSDVNVKPVSDYAPEDAALLCSVGRLICAWTMLEQSLEAKVGLMREGMGDVRTVGARTRPSMSKLMTELRTMVAMRDRRNASALMEISAIERDMQRIDRFRDHVIAYHEEQGDRDGSQYNRASGRRLPTLATLRIKKIEAKEIILV